MTLTVPRAGTIAGASAQVQTPPPSQLGNALAELGQKMASLGNTWHKNQITRMGAQAQLDITREMGALRLQSEQTGDPVQMGQIWDQGVGRIRAKFLPEGLDPQLYDQLNQTVTGLSDQHAFELSKRVAGLQQSQQTADWMLAREAIKTDAGAADPTTLTALLDQGKQRIAALQAQGIYTPAQAVEETLKLQQDVYGNRAEMQIATDPAAFLADLTDGQYTGLSADQSGKFAIAAGQEVARRTKAEADAADLAAKQTSKALATRLRAISARVNDGYNPADISMLTDPTVLDLAQKDPDVAAALGEAEAAQALRAETPNIKAMTPNQLTAMLQAEKARPVVASQEAAQTARVALISKWLEEATTGWATDAPGTARAAGLPVPELPAFDPANPQAFSEGIASRTTFAASMRARGLTDGQAMFSPGEIAALKPVLDPKADPSTKLALAQAIAAGAPDQINTVAQIIGGDPAFAQAARLIAQTRQTAIPAQILQGQYDIAQGRFILPTDADQVRAINGIAGAAFGRDSAEAAQIRAAAIAIYATETANLDPDISRGSNWVNSDEAQQVYQKAVQIALGATPDTEGKLSIGGLQEVNGGKVVLPPGIARATVEATFDALSHHLAGDSWDPKPSDQNILLGQPDQPAGWTGPRPANPDYFRAFRAASTDGSAPDLGVTPDDWAARWEQVRMVRVGASNIYELHLIDENGNEYPIARAGDAMRRAYRFNLNDLVRGVQQ